MTLSANDMANLSEYTVSDTQSGLTTSVFTYLSTVAKNRLDADLESISTTESIADDTYDYLHGLMVAHLYTVKKGATGFQSMNAHGFSVTIKPGSSSYLLQYEDEISKWAGVVEQRTVTSTSTDTLLDVQRCDADMPGLRLDHSQPKSFFRSLP